MRFIPLRNEIINHAGFLVFWIGIGSYCFPDVITLSGRVLDSNAQSNPIPNATVSLAKGISTFTDASGQFSLDFSPTGIMRPSSGTHPLWKITGSMLVFSISIEKKVRIELYDLCGRKQCVLFERTCEPGAYSLALPTLLKKPSSTGFFIIKIQIGPESMIGAFTPVSGSAGLFADKNYVVSGRGASYFALSSPVLDSLKIYRMGFVAKAYPLTANTAGSFGNILLSRTAEELGVERKADSLLNLMSLEQKAAQMAQAQINAVSDDEIAAGGYGSVFNGGEQPIVPNKSDGWATKLDGIQSKVLSNSPLKIPIIYGIDAVHGNAKVVGSTIFPHNIGLGCTYDTSLVREAAEITASECAAVGIHLTFAPALSVVRNERWGRTYEGFGETPEISSMMGCAFLRGLQGNGDISKSSAIAGCIKHFLGDGATKDGANLGIAEISESIMRAVHLPPYAAAVRDNAACVMPSFTAWSRNGQSFKQSLDTYAMTQLLKQELGFDGFCLSDYNAIPLACGSSSGTDYTVDCVAQSVNAGMDMAMIAGANWVVSGYVNSIVTGVNESKIQISRVNDAVKRILRVKFRMHLWDHPKSDATLRSQMGGAEHRAKARECVRKSLVLLKHEDNALPLGKSERIVVVGPWANSLGLQCGGWTLNWQGNPKYNSDSLPGGATILDGFKNLGGANVSFDTTGNNLSSFDKIVLVIGELPYAEGLGDDGFTDASYPYDPNPDWGGLYKNHTITIQLSGLPSYGLFTKCASAGKPLICVLVTGRPILFSPEELSKCKAIVAAWLPGSEGAGVADVLYGERNFYGKLTHSWPSSKEQIPINAGPTYTDEPHGSGGTPLFPIGHGLRY